MVRFRSTGWQCQAKYPNCRNEITSHVSARIRAKRIRVLRAGASAAAGFANSDETAWDLRSFRWAYRGTAVPVKAAVLTRLLSYRGEPVADSGENNSSP